MRKTWKQVNHEYEQAIMEARAATSERRESEAMSKAWRVITDAFAQSMLIQTTQKPKYMQHQGRTLKFFQATVGGFTKPGKIGEVALQVRQLQSWADKMMNGRKKSVPIDQGGKIAVRSRRCDRATWETLMTKGHFWLAEPMKEVGAEMNEQTMEKTHDGVLEGN